MKRINRFKLKKVFSKYKTHLGIKYYIEEKNNNFILLEKSNLFGKIITILLAPVYIVMEGISEYLSTLKLVFNWNVSSRISKEKYDMLKGD